MSNAIGGLVMMNILTKEAVKDLKSFKKLAESAGVRKAERKLAEMAPYAGAVGGGILGAAITKTPTSLGIGLGSAAGTILGSYEAIKFFRKHKIKRKKEPPIGIPVPAYIKRG